MYSKCMGCPLRWCQTGGPNLHPVFGRLFANFSVLLYVCRLVFIHRATARPRGQTSSWRPSCAAWHPRTPLPGVSSCHGRSMPSTPTFHPPLVAPRSNAPWAISRRCSRTRRERWACRRRRHSSDAATGRGGTHVPPCFAPRPG